MKYRFISVAGTMGIGKTSLVKIIADEFGFRPVLENFAANPFLPKFYTDMKRWAYHSQTFFLIEKIKLLQSLVITKSSRTLLLDTPIYQDVYSYAQAQRVIGNMQRDEWNQYFKLYIMFESELPTPDLIIFLTCPVDKIYERIVSRGRLFETKVQQQNLINYLAILDKLNRNWIKKIGKKIKIMKLETDGFNYIKDKNQRKALRKKISQYFT